MRIRGGDNMKVLNENKREAALRPWIFTTLISLALLGGIVGGLYLSQLTLGVGLIGSACLLAILGRITQAHNQHSELMDKLDSQKGNTNQG